ncbi:MAG: alcohol dehydrogenase catalytic domain-containing protein [Bacilli bacterium]|nr:alcohol dehydrogenase catalytic domain-containing protein [Bacilli bacterium]
MFSLTYKVTSPNVIEEFIEEVVVKQGQTLVKVERMAICKADIRYFLGLRNKNVLDHKYPLTPIHEAVGTVIKDYSGLYKKGDKVILVPNYVDRNMCKGCPNTRCHNEELGENYCPYAVFRSSNKDGFLRPFFVAGEEGLVKYNNSIDPNIAVWSELLSVSVAACRRLGVKEKQRIAVFGDGIMAYMVYLILVHKYHCDVTIFGVVDDKMNSFKHANKAKYATYIGERFDTLIEAVGGRFSADAINQMIDLSLVGADLLLMGVSEENAPINTRKVLEKGLSIKGVTRSNYQDFQEVARLLEKEELREDIKPLILSENIIESVNDIYKVFDADIKNTQIIGKNIMKW